MDTLARWSAGLMAAAAIIAATAASATIWLLVTDPVGGADAVTAAFKGDIAPFVRAVSSVVCEALGWLLAFR
jgi:hypothetical protein